ncbi:MAG TPA: hypothetical protein VKD28_06720 [Gemmatimonadales bacterium]|nr:hypothetical protein [Gemmatimonadales bacterium]
MKNLFALVLAVTTTGCGPTKRFDQDLQGREKVSEIWYRTDVSHVRRVIPATIESVWRVLPASIESLQFPGAPSVDVKNHIYVTPRLKIESRLYPDESNSLYLDCGRTIGGQPAADQYLVIFNVMTRLTATPAGETEIDIIVDGTAQDMKERSFAVRCHGTGRFEETIIQRIETSLASR